MKTQKQINELPMVSKEEFDEKVEKLCETNWKVKLLCRDLKSWEKFPVNVLWDLFSILKCKPLVYKY